MWRSLVAHLHGVQGVGGSSPLTPTNKIKDLASKGLSPFFFPGVTFKFSHTFSHTALIADHEEKQWNTTI